MLKPDEITLVVHGPEVFDQGDVSRLLRILSPHRTLVAGVMARTAAEESGLPVEFSGEPPSALIRNHEGMVVLVNRGKTFQSGQIFGEIVSRKVGPRRGLFHLECSSEILYLWNNPDAHQGRELAIRTGFRPVALQSTGYTGGPLHREIRGCLPGEAVCINGLVIGRAIAETVVIEKAAEQIRVVSGLIPKPHGLEKLHNAGPVSDLSTLWCKSGNIRSSPPLARRGSLSAGRVVVIDHCGHDVYHALDTPLCGILAIGDDTTSVCGHIAAHRGIPVFGIVDGDADHLLKPRFAPGSVVVRVDPGTDDTVGQELAEQIAGKPVVWESWVRETLHHIAGRGFIINKIN
ncbi:MAG: DUF2117 domain-containing protein [Methanomicrobiales archaeon]|nr:DUF2117 domain-containing protein [Methanomicrobiales archaeon]